MGSIIMTVMNRALIAALCLALGGCAHDRARAGVPNTPRLYRQEVAAGDKIHDYILSSFYVYTEPELLAYLTEITEMLSSQAERRLPYRVTVLYHEKIYATSAPGGHIYLTTGLLGFLENEAEVAAVLAHEIGQLQFRDPRFSRSHRAVETMTEGSALVLPALGQIGALAALGLVVMDHWADSSKTTPQERLIRADALALGYLVKAGYDPQGFMDLVQRFSSAERRMRSLFYDYYRSRPWNPDRVRALQGSFARLDLSDKRLEVHRPRFQQMIEGVRQI
jgi:predicted Zn-dependent protease